MKCILEFASLAFCLHFVCSGSSLCNADIIGKMLCVHYREVSSSGTSGTFLLTECSHDFYFEADIITVSSGEEMLLRVNAFSSCLHYLNLEVTVHGLCPWSTDSYGGESLQFRLSRCVIQPQVCSWFTFACGDSRSLGRTISCLHWNKSEPWYVVSKYLLKWDENWYICCCGNFLTVYVNTHIHMLFFVGDWWQNIDCTTESLFDECMTRESKPVYQTILSLKVSICSQGNFQLFAIGAAHFLFVYTYYRPQEV